MTATNSFAELLVRLRKEAGLSRSQLSEGSGLSYPYISQLETGQRSPSRKATWALARPLGVDPSVLEAAVPADESDPQAIRRAEMLTSGALRSQESPRIAALSIRSAEPSLAGEPDRDGAPTRSDIVGDILDLLDEFDSSERLEVLAEVQKLAVQRLVEEAARKPR